jgi:Lrp/AsnC family transcriptional regulator, leucine-responsive regulatory protein
MTRSDLDDLDRRILTALQSDNRRSITDLAHLVGSSPASCQRRVARLRAGGAILADRAVIDPRLGAASMTVIVTVELERERIDLVETFKRAMQAHGQVTHCYMVTGDADFVLTVAAKDIADFDAFVKAALYANPNIRKFRSMIALDTIKAEDRVFL